LNESFGGKVKEKESMGNWKRVYRSFYYAGAPEPEDPELVSSETVLLTIDIQNVHLEPRNAPMGYNIRIYL
jgi:hypothetical protein